MRYEAYLDLPQGEKKVITSSGDVVGLSKDISKVLQEHGIRADVFGDFLIEYIRESQPLYTLYVSGKQFSMLCPNIAFFIELWITSAEKTFQSFLAIINYSGSIQMSISKPELFDRVILDVTKKTIDFLDCLRVEMPFLYRFIIFEFFSSFRKLSKVKFEGMVNKNFILADYMDRGLVWEIDSTVMDYTTTISKKILSI